MEIDQRRVIVNKFGAGGKQDFTVTRKPLSFTQRHAGHGVALWREVSCNSEPLHCELESDLDRHVQEAVKLGRSRTSSQGRMNRESLLDQH